MPHRKTHRTQSGPPQTTVRRWRQPALFDRETVRAITLSRFEVRQRRARARGEEEASLLTVKGEPE